MLEELAETGVYFTKHAPRKSLHDPAENLPGVLPDQVILPVGDEPLTVALQMMAEPTTTDERVQVREVLLDMSGIVRVEDPNAGQWLSSPE